MNIEQLIKDIDSRDTYMERIKEARKLRDNKKKQIVIGAIDNYLDSIKEYSVSLIQRIKDGDSEAFDELLEIKDIRNFMHHYGYHVRKYHRFRYSKEDVMNEMKMQIWYHIFNNYRIYNEPHELSLLINSMRGWIKFQVSNGLKDLYKPKKFTETTNLFTDNIIDESIDNSDIYIEEVINDCLTEQEKEIFRLRFYDEIELVELGKMLGMSKDSVRRRYEKIKDVLREYLNTEGTEWLN